MIKISEESLIKYFNRLNVNLENSSRTTISLIPSQVKYLVRKTLKDINNEIPVSEHEVLSDSIMKGMK